MVCGAFDSSPVWEFANSCICPPHPHDTITANHKSAPFVFYAAVGPADANLTQSQMSAVLILRPNAEKRRSTRVKTRIWILTLTVPEIEPVRFGFCWSFSQKTLR